jgi:DNA-binding beta-propeller fold protein YncE
VACEEDAKLLVVDLTTMKQTQTMNTGPGPDVLAFDTGLERLYVGCESGVISVFQAHGGRLVKLGDVPAGPRSHTVAVDSATHKVYVPLENVNGRPVLRIMLPSDGRTLGGKVAS